jgi:lipoate-protein ligase A
MQTWRLLDFEYSDAPSNLALEEALARQVGEGKSPPTLRLWRNRKAAVIGENQCARLELQLDACKELGVEVIRRFTGGGAVYHDLGNLNYSICAPKPSPSSLQFQQTLFRQALDCAVTCLGRLGLDSTKAPVNTVMVRGRKISGGAGAVRWGSVFYHGSILVSTDLEVVWKVLRREQPRATGGFVQSTRVPVTSAERELGREIPLDRVKEALKNAFTETFNACLIPGPATEQEIHAAATLVNEKYANEKWNLKM